MQIPKWQQYFLAVSLSFAVPSSGGFAQGVSIDTRSASESQSNVRVQGGGNGVNVDTRSAAGSQSNVRVQGGSPGQSIDINSGAAAATQNRVRVDQGGAGAAVDTRSGAAAQTKVRVDAPAMPAPIGQQPDASAVVPISPVPAQPPSVAETQAGATSGAAVQTTTRPASCEKIEEVTIDEMAIKIVNKSCRGKVINLQAWRENGKTKVQFIFDNKGFSNTTIKMSETWFDRRGRTINESIDEQKFAVESGHNKAVVITGPVPQAMTAVITFYR